MTKGEGLVRTWTGPHSIINQSGSTPGFLNPQAFRPETRMPNLGLKVKEARAITAFLVSFQPEKEGEEIKFKVPEDWKQYLSAKGDPKRGEKKI